jgi:calcineurin-like phosphoesterase family protein
MRKLTLNTDHYPNIWFTSDWHLGHNKEFLYGPRGCKDREEYCSFMVDMINAQAGPDDIIVHIGDMSLTCTQHEFMAWLLQINCKNIFSIVGNHDNRFVKLIEDLRYPGSEATAMLGYKNIQSMDKFQEITVLEPSNVPYQKARRRHITLCHFPLQIWNKSHHGTWHLCGHSHGSFDQTSVYDKVGKRFDCGVENALEWSKGEAVMFHYKDVEFIMSKKEIFNGDHHNEKTT